MTDGSLPTGRASCFTGAAERSWPATSATTVSIRNSQRDHSRKSHRRAGCPGNRHVRFGGRPRGTGLAPRRAPRRVADPTSWLSGCRRLSPRYERGTRATSGDDAAMVQARSRFLSTGTCAPIREFGSRLTADAVSEQGTVVDVGCGTGYYLWPAYSTICLAPVVWVWTHRCARCARQPLPTASPPRWSGTSPVPSHWPTGWPMSCWTCSPHATRPSSTAYCARPAD